MAIPVTSAIGGTTSGSMQTISTTARSRGGPSRTATRAGTTSSRASAMVAAARESERNRLSVKPSADRIPLYAAKVRPCPGTWTVKTNEEMSGVRKYSPATVSTAPRQ
ncbi:hypothetical protein GA0115255_104692 [Streptomyces sp. Ncost-T6T-2b]|nr:hypothetical protein GA0115255_104692 [Streptomyces sp. Ncost-T6T-2b]